MFTLRAFVIFLCLSFAYGEREAGPNHPATTVKEVKWPNIGVNTCYYTLKRVKWGFNTSSIGYLAFCSYEPAFGSMAYCLTDFLQKRGIGDELSTSAERLELMCSYYTEEPLPISVQTLKASSENATIYMQRDYNASAIQFGPVIGNLTGVDNYATAYYHFLHNIDLSNIYGGAICGYFLGVLLLATVFNFLKVTGYHKWFLKNSLINSVRASVFMPTIGGRHAQELSFFKVFTGLVPTRFEFVVVFGYVVLHTVLIAVSYKYDPYNFIFASKEIQIARYVADRTGIMAFAHFPLIVLFATRNNFFQWLTGLHYTTFIVFHKWVARMMFLDAMIHSAAYTHYCVVYKTWATARTAVYWQFGVAATIFAGLILLFSFYYFRKNFYETFLYTHIILGALFFYGCWEHVCEMGWMEWLYAAIAVWTVERIVRVFRIVCFGFPKSKIELFGEEFIRITVKKGNRLFNAKPGQFAYIYFWSPLLFWQSHPFTVMDSLLEDGSVVIVLKAKKGLTKTLRNKLLKNNKTMEMRVSLEGPYGCGSALQHYDSVLLLTGGSGLPGPLSHAFALGATLENSEKRRVKLVLCVRGGQVLETYKLELKKLQNLDIEVEIYNTELKAKDNISTDSTSSILQLEKESTENVTTNAVTNTISPTTITGRPNLDRLIKEAVEGSPSTAIFCCGPSVMVDQVRDLSASYVKSNCNSIIDYFEDNQVW